jgi:AraC-like DNA-binding protein
MSFYEIEAEQKKYYFFKKRGDYETPAHFHGSLELLFVEEGSLEATIDGETRLLKGGEGCFCDSFSVHCFSTPAPQSQTYVLLGGLEYFESVFALFGKKTPPRFFNFQNFALLRELLALCGKKRANEAGRYAAFESATRLLIAEIAETNPLVFQKPNKKNSLVCEILQYAEQNLQADLRLQAVAKKFGYSHEYLSRITHKYLGENWNACVNRLRVRRADALLKAESERSVLEIAYACGFDSPNTFYRAYKKEFGVPPRRKIP